MSTTNKAHTGCSDRCEPLVVERNRYFNGKFMTARDFVAEQDFLLHRHWLHNRLFHGSGVVCGYEVTKHPDEKHCPDRLCIGPGIAIDCCGRELILRSPTVIQLPELPEPPESPKSPSPGDEGDETEAYQGAPDPSGPAQDNGTDEEPYRVMLCAHYCEEEIEPVPAIGDDCTCDPSGEQANRIRHGVRLDWLRFDRDEQAGCWNLPGGGKAERHDDCADPVPGPASGCLEPSCPCGSCVALALVTVGEDGTVELDTDGRHRLPPPSEHLTRIVQTNWTHGQEMSIGDLRDLDRLEICFDRDLRETGVSATGIGAETFVVQHAGEAETLEYVPYDPDQPPDLVDGHIATFHIDANFLARNRRSLPGSTIHITLLCDFVLDCHGLAVDGDHIGGRLPSGNGLEGGTFRSWFHIGTGAAPYEEEQ